MNKYRKKPVVIEAVQYLPDDEAQNDKLLPFLEGCTDWQQMDGPAIAIPTLEGTMTVRPGDWIIKGVQGEFYPCKNAIFEATYEAVA